MKNYRNFRTLYTTLNEKKTRFVIKGEENIKYCINSNSAIKNIYIHKIEIHAFFYNV